MKKKIFIGSDHAGFETKEYIIKLLEKELGKKIILEDCGTYSNESVDYSDYAKIVCKKVLNNNKSNNNNYYGILICGSGTGMQIAANKINGIRAVFSYDKYSAIMGRKDNNANVLTLRAREFPKSKYKKIIINFLETKFSNFSRHKRRIEKLKKIEKENC